MFKDGKQSSVFGFCQPRFNENLLLSVHGFEKKGRLWDVETAKVLTSFEFIKPTKSFAKMPTCCVWHENEILVGTVDGTLMKFDARSAEKIETVAPFPLSSSVQYQNAPTVSITPGDDKKSFFFTDSKGYFGKGFLKSESSNEIDTLSCINSFDVEDNVYVKLQVPLGDSTYMRCQASNALVVKADEDKLEV